MSPPRHTARSPRFREGLRSWLTAKDPSRRSPRSGGIRPKQEESEEVWGICAGWRRWTESANGLEPWGTTAAVRQRDAQVQARPTRTRCRPMSWTIPSAIEWLRPPRPGRVPVSPSRTNILDQDRPARGSTSRSSVLSQELERRGAHQAHLAAQDGPQIQQSVRGSVRSAGRRRGTVAGGSRRSRTRPLRPICLHFSRSFSRDSASRSIVRNLIRRRFDRRGPGGVPKDQGPGQSSRIKIAMRARRGPGRAGQGRHRPGRWAASRRTEGERRAAEPLEASAMSPRKPPTPAETGKGAADSRRRRRCQGAISAFFRVGRARFDNRLRTADRPGGQTKEREASSRKKVSDSVAGGLLCVRVEGVEAPKGTQCPLPSGVLVSVTHLDQTLLEAPQKPPSRPEEQLPSPYCRGAGHVHSLLCSVLKA